MFLYILRYWPRGSPDLLWDHKSCGFLDHEDRTTDIWEWRWLLNALWPALNIKFEPHRKHQRGGCHFQYYGKHWTTEQWRHYLLVIQQKQNRIKLQGSRSCVYFQDDSMLTWILLLGLGRGWRGGYFRHLRYPYWLHHKGTCFICGSICVILVLLTSCMCSLSNIPSSCTQPFENQSYCVLRRGGGWHIFSWVR